MKQIIKENDKFVVSEDLRTEGRGIITMPFTANELANILIKKGVLLESDIQ